MISLSDRYGALCANAAAGSPSKVWDRAQCPRGWRVEQFIHASHRADFTYVWRAVHVRTGAVDARGFTRKWVAIRRAWELATQTEGALRAAVEGEAA